MILVMPFSCRCLSPAITTPVFTEPMTPERSVIDASSWAMSAPRSFFASSSRSTISILSFALPTWTPPAALSSEIASLAPSRNEAPIGAEPPENGPVRASFRVCADAGSASAAASRAKASLDMVRPPSVGFLR